MQTYENVIETMEKPKIIWRYELTTVDIDCEDDMRYTTHGIRALDPNGDVVAAYRDVSTNKDFVQAIVDKCNLHGASVIHLQDILYDELG